MSRDICFVGWHQTKMQNLVEPTLHTPGYLEEKHSKQGARDFSFFFFFFKDIIIKEKTKLKEEKRASDMLYKGIPAPASKSASLGPDLNAAMNYS